MNQRSHQIAGIRQVESSLTTVHLESFPEAQRVVVPPPAPAVESAIATELGRVAVVAIAWWRFGQRRQTRKVAIAGAPAEVARRNAANAEWLRASQAQADAHWASLVANDPHTVMATLEAAFEDNKSPAAPIDCSGSSVTVLILFRSVDVVPSGKAAVTPGGKPTVHTRTKTEQNKLYVTALGSTVLATLKETFAIAPSVTEARVVVVRKDLNAATPGDYLAVIYAGRFQRARLAAMDWPRVDVVEELMIAPDAMLTRRGSAKEVAPLDLGDQPALREVLAHLRDQL